MKYIYIAGPYTNPDPVVNTKKAIEVGDIVSRMGYYPYIPHLTMFWHLLYAHDIEFWYKHDLMWLEKCDALIRFPGESSGADKEIKYAENLDIEIFYGIEEFIAYNEMLRKAGKRA